MLSKRKKRPTLHRIRLRFGRRAPKPEPRPFDLAPRQTFDTMDLSEYDDDLIEMKRRAEADGVYVQIPKRAAVWKEPTPLQLNGLLLSEVIVQLRHGSR
jgi:hypothetical protein